MTTNPPKKSDLGVRVLSAIVMVAVAGTALWLGGWVWTLFVAAVGLGVLWEWWGLVNGFVSRTVARIAWLTGGVGYVGLAVVTFLALRGEPVAGWSGLLIILLSVIGTDIGAYFAGRAIGGPKIAPAISPSKTWSGLVGGILGASFGTWIAVQISMSDRYMVLLNEKLQAQGSSPTIYADDLVFPSLLGCVLIGTFAAVIAQSGDFFESWMKRKAGVKDSGRLIPGHGGLFDRVDGLLAVAFAFGIQNLHLIKYAQ